MVHLHTFGTLEITHSGDGHVPADLTQPKCLALLVYLATARPRGFHRRDTLLGLFWPELNEQHARGALSQALLRLRAVVGTEVIVSRGANEVCVDPSRLWCDVVEFETHVSLAEAERGLDLYRGDFLAGVHLPGLEEFEHWVEAERTRYRGVAIGAAWKLAESAEQSGRAETAAKWAQIALAFAPDDELAVRRQMEMLIRLGDRAGAVSVYDEFVRRLRLAYETEPSPKTSALAESLRSNGGEKLVPTSRREAAGADAGIANLISMALDGPTSSTPDRGGYAVPPNIRSLKHSLKMRRRLGLAVVATAVLVAIGVTRIRAFNGVPVNSGAGTKAPTRIAVFPFTYRGSDRSDYLSEGMVDLLSIAFDGAGDLRRVDPYALLRLLKREPAGTLDPERARAIVAAFNADLFVLGTIVSADTLLLVSATLYDANHGGEALGTAHQKGSVASLPSLIDALATELLRDHLQSDTRVASGQSVVATRTTGSLVALKEYLTGEQLLRSARYDDAARAYESAITADSTFGLAYTRLGVALSDGARSEWGWSMQDAIEKATLHSERLAARDRAKLTAIDAFWRRRSPEEGIRLLQGVVAEYPDDAEAWWRLGEMEFHHGLRTGRPIDEIRATLLRSSELDSTNPVLIERRWLANVEENEEEDERLSRRMLAQAPGADFHPLLRVNVALLSGDRAGALKTIERVRDLRGLVRLFYVEQVAMHTLDTALLRNATTLLTSAQNPPGMRVNGYKIMAHVLAASGHWKSARAELSAMQAVDPGIAVQTLGMLTLSPAAPRSLPLSKEVRSRIGSWIPASAADSIHRLYLLGLLSARTGEHADALSKARAMEITSRELLLNDPTSLLAAEARDRALSVRAESAWLRGAPSEALRYLEATLPEKWWPPIANGDLFANWGYERYMRAEVLRQLGRETEAKQWYSGLGITEYELVFRPVVNLRLGEAAEREGDLRAASGYYRRAIARWTDADPDVPAYHNEGRTALSRVNAAKVGVTNFSGIASNR
jgi:DNA-binding SARP family transcriptional activator